MVDGRSLSVSFHTPSVETNAGVDLRNPLNPVPTAAGIIIGVGGVSLRITDTFELGGIALGTIVVITGYWERSDPVEGPRVGRSTRLDTDPQRRHG